MLQWLRLLIFLPLLAAVRGRDVKCDDIEYMRYCWNSFTDVDNGFCWFSVVKDKAITEDQILSISGKFFRGILLNVEIVEFRGGSISKMPKLLQKSTSEEILQADLWRTNTTVVNSQFFENSGRNFSVFGILKNKNLIVESSAFQNWTRLEYLCLGDNKLPSIPLDAFLGLNKLIWLDLSSNRLEAIHSEWFQSLNNLNELNLSRNQFKQVPVGAFDKLTKLRRLDLRNNKIRTIKNEVFQQTTMMEKISLSENRVKEIQIDTFKHLSRLTYLNLEDNDCINSEFIMKSSGEIAQGLTPCYSTMLAPYQLLSNEQLANTEDNGDYSYEDEDFVNLNNKQEQFECQSEY